MVVFLSKDCKAADWRGLEWQGGRDLLTPRDADRFMFLRLDNAETQGLLSIDGYLDVHAMSNDEVAAAILSRLGEVGPASRPVRAFTAKLPPVSQTLIGREKEIAFLDRVWADPTTNLVQVVAAGGAGKTALVDKWFRKHLGEATFFGWSFHSQGSSLDRQASSDSFFADIISGWELT